MADKPASQFNAISTLASGDKFVAVDVSESELRTATGTVVLAWLGASLDMSTIASGGALPVAYGGTGATSLAAGYIPYSNGGTAYAASPLYTDGANVRIIGASATDSPKVSLYQSATERAYIQYQDSGDILRIDSDGVVQIAAGNVIGVWMTSTGKVAFGPSTPGARVDIQQQADSSSDGMRTVNTAATKTGHFWINAGGDLQIHTVSAGAGQLVLANAGNVGIGTTPNQKLTVEGTMSLKEQAAANADTAAYGQIWVGDTTPNELWFTDDAGTDTQISPHPKDAPEEFYRDGRGPGKEWIDKRVYRYKGEIVWLRPQVQEVRETFDEYNARLGLNPGDPRYAEKKDWDANEQRQFELSHKSLQEWTNNARSVAKTPWWNRQPFTDTKPELYKKRKAVS